MSKLIDLLERDFIRPRKISRSKNAFTALAETEKEDARLALVAAYKKWKKNTKSDLLESLSHLPNFDQYKEILYGIQKGHRITECGNFQGKGYPTVDICKKCGCETVTRSGLKSYARDAIIIGKTSGVSYYRAILERETALAHGVIEEHEFTTKRLDDLILKSTVRRTIENSSDIGVDSSGSADGKKKQNTKRAGGLSVIKNPLSLKLGSIVFYGEKSRRGEICQIIPGGKFSEYRFEVEDFDSLKKDWLPLNQLKTREPEEAITSSETLSLFEISEDGEIEAVLFPGYHG